MDIYEKIDRLLDSSGISRRQLAIKACIPPSMLQTALSRKKGLSLLNIQKIANVLGVPVHQLLDIEPQICRVSKKT